MYMISTMDERTVNLWLVRSGPEKLLVRGPKMDPSGFYGLVGPDQIRSKISYHRTNSDRISYLVQSSMKDHDETDNRENIISLKRQFLESSIVEHSNSILLFNDVKNYYF